MSSQKYLMGKLFFTQKYKLQIFLFLLFSVCSLFLSQSAFGATLNLTATWTLNTEPDIREYRLYRTDVSRTLIGTTPHPNSSYPFTVTVADGSSGTLLFALTAVDTSNYESADSNQASYSYNLSTTTVTINATDNTATEAGATTGTFTVSRTGSTSSALTVYYAVSGTAASGSDYSALSGSVTIPAGSSTATITVIPINDTSVESDETVIVTLSTNASYTVGTPNSATVTITSDDLNIGSFPFSDDFSTDKGWTGYEPGRWERGSAVAGGGENGNPDPATDHSPSSDNKILGFAIGGDYTNNLVEKSIVSPLINCTGRSQVFLKFWRYFNVESNYYDHAKVYVSNDGTNWVQLWENPGFNLIDNQWIQVVYDISSVAANQATVYIKFTMGPTNSSGRYSGLNIDDLEVTSNYAGPLALYVPSGDSPNPNIDEIMIENGLGIKHSNEIPTNLNNYNALIVSKNEACNLTTANYIKNFVQNGDGAIIMGGTPKLLAGDTDNLSTIIDWFGAGWYGNDCGYGTIIANNSLGTDLLINDKLDYAPTNTCGGASVYNLNADSTWISRWGGGRTHSFIHSFGQGRIFYYAGNPGFSGDPDPEILENGHELFEAGLLWAANCVFSDIPSGYWAYDYITSIYNAGLTTGCAQDNPNTPNNEKKYCPEDNVTREQMAAFIIRAVEGEPPLNYCDSGSLFTDVTSDMWSCKYIKRLEELGITIGYGDGRYGPYDFVTRDQMAAFLSRAFLGMQ